MTKLRCSDHKLRIEEGRWNKPSIPRTERKCYMCNQVEDEIHFLTDCKLYGSRDQFWNKIYNKVPQISTHSSTDRFIFLMTQEDPDVMEVVLQTTCKWLAFRNFLNENFYNQK